MAPDGGASEHQESRTPVRPCSRSLRKNHSKRHVFPRQKLISCLFRLSAQLIRLDDAFGDSFEAFGRVIGHSSGQKRCSRCLHRRRAEQIAQADQVVGDHVQTKHLLDAPASIDRLGVAAEASGVLGHVGRDTDATHLSLGDLAIHDQGMAVVHEHMAPIARLSCMGVGLARQ